MATHYVSSSTEETIDIYLFTNSTRTSEIIASLEQNSQITVIDEYIDLNCKFHYVSSSVGEGYLLNKYIFRLDGTPESAPYVCTIPMPNNAYVEPEWQSIQANIPYINDKSNEYCISIVSDAYSINQDETVILKKGIKYLFEYYNKPSDDETVERYLSYFIFAKIKDYYVPFRPFMRTRYLISVHRKYFDAIEEDEKSETSIPLEADSSKIDFVLEINLKEINDKFFSLESILNLYDTDVLFSNTTLVFSTNANQELVDDSIFLQMAFSEKSKNVNSFKQRLDNLFSINNIPINVANNNINEYYVQFAMNNECNIIYDVSVKQNNACKKLRVGIEEFLKSEPVMDATTVNFVKNIHNISKINKCKVPWYDFSEKYIFPPVIILEPPNILQKQSYELFKDLYNAFLVSQAASAREPTKTPSQLLEEQITIENTKLVSYFSSTISPFVRKVYQGDNALDPNNLQKTLADLERAVSESPLTSKTDLYIIKDSEGVYYKVVKNNSTPPGWTKDIQYNSDTSIFKIDTEEPTVSIDGSNYTLLKANKADVAKNNAINATNSLRQQLQKVYNFINKIGICTLADLVQGCLFSLVRSLFEDTEVTDFLDQSIIIGATKSFKLDTIVNEVIPYLPKEQQQFIYEQILLDLGCVNKNSMLYTLKNYLSSEAYTTLNLETATYEEIVSEVAKQMSIEIVST